MEVAVMPTFALIVAIVFFGLLLVATVVGCVLFLSGRPGSGVRRVGGSLALVCGSILAALVLAAGVVVPVVSEVREGEVRAQKQADLREIGEQLHRHQAEAEAKQEGKQVDAGLTRLPDENATPNPADALTPLTGHDDRTNPPAERPNWTNVSSTTNGDVALVAIAGQQFATVEEARRDVAAAARSQLLADFERTYGTSAALLRKLSDDELRSLAVRNEFVETVDRDFGSFFAPMHRVWWQVELSPAVRSELYPKWRAKEQEIRTLVVAGNLVMVTIGLAAVSWFTRKKPVVQPPPTQPAATNPVVLGVGAATLFAQRCRRWWKC